MSYDRTIRIFELITLGRLLGGRSQVYSEMTSVTKDAAPRCAAFRIRKAHTLLPLIGVINFASNSMLSPASPISNPGLDRHIPVISLVESKTAPVIP